MSLFGGRKKDGSGDAKAPLASDADPKATEGASGRDRAQGDWYQESRNLSTTTDKWRIIRKNCRKNGLKNERCEKRSSLKKINRKKERRRQKKEVVPIQPLRQGSGGCERSEQPHAQREAGAIA